MEADRRRRTFARLSFVAAVLALVVIVLGAYVRLSDAGLGCPDWPGCYGRIVAPYQHLHVEEARDAFPGAEVHTGKAWKEMIHRYAAGTLGLLILALAVLAVRNRRDPRQAVGLPLFLVALVVFQAALGMWTVTMLLRPAVVTLHLITGMLTLALLWWQALRHSDRLRPAVRPRANLLPWARLGLVVLFVQIALGGWTSSNYVALHCPDFPTCQEQWIPPLNLRDAFDVVGAPGVNYEGGRMSLEGGVTVHFLHRLGALVTLLYLGALALAAVIAGASRTLRSLGGVLLAILSVQIALGIANVVLRLPLPVAVGHNAGAALLVIALITLVHALRTDRPDARPQAI
ncbi:MAG: COX15/CtaA family protein [Chromatiales bacterium]|jgi:cytochrome c oxidase assembly protein subunit 15